MIIVLTAIICFQVGMPLGELLMLVMLFLKQEHYVHTQHGTASTLYVLQLNDLLDRQGQSSGHTSAI